MQALFFSRSRVRQWAEWLALIVFLYAFVSLVFYVFPMVFRMASNADSLVMLDFARDALIGQSIAHWNLPRAPYLFPDALIGMVVMALGWSNAFTLKLIAVINYLLLLWICTAVMRTAKGLERIAYWQVGVLISVAFFSIALVFPVAAANVYWQMFASGAHFLMAIVVMGVLHLSRRWRQEAYPQWMLWAIFLLCFAEAVSDSIAALLLFIWIGAQLLWRLPHQLKPRADLLLVGAGLVLGTLASLLIPRQSMLNSFFSVDKFIASAFTCWEWLISSPVNYAYVLLLLALIAAYPFLLQGSWPRSKKSALLIGLQSDVLLPSLGVMAATPFVFQEVGSIRYLAFPALISLISLGLLYHRIGHGLAKRSQVQRLLIGFCFALVLMLVSAWQWSRDQIGPQMQDNPGKDMIGLAVGAQTELAIACLNQAKAQFPLEDGVATYWNARPTRFASNFTQFFAQINPWRPRSGYMVWGNNAIDFVYRDSEQTIPRQYNHLLATKHELASRLWGSLPAQATGVMECPMHTIFYFDRPDILWNYVFPLDVPFGFTKTPTQEQSAKTPTQQTNRIFPADDFFTVVGVRQGARLEATGQAGVLAYGPYIPLLAGHYRLIAKGALNASSPANVVLDVGAQFGRQVIAAKAIQLPSAASNHAAEEIGSLDFSLDKTTEDVEFRLQVPATARGTLLEFELRRLQAQ
jgi:hypothetical protein